MTKTEFTTIPSVNLKREASGMNRNKKRLKPKIVYPTAKKLNSAVAVVNIKAAIRFIPVRNVERFVFPTLNNAMIPAAGQYNSDKLPAVTIEKKTLITVLIVRIPIRIYSPLFLF
ncbi:hypothetical protein D356_00934 [Enterococcus faecium SD2A-2]|uniref:Uncharacterized protein n=1 Tax=Enterococcus faecium SD2A-2 TaxID=1244154 RepID=A0AB73AB40_ENTFC|nr:hypothetical protein D356_00934 [Enterococcus faecium SD2A-2]KXA06146.1 hypothetical protein HMPREF3199_02445 [Enterococcus faecium]